MKALLLALLLTALALPAGSLSAAAWRIAYLNAGVASTEQTWRATDYENAVGAVVTSKIPLPTFSDSRGKAVLKRIVSDENLAFIEDKTIPVGQRFEDFMLIQSNMGALLGHYVAAANQGNSRLADELTAFYGFMLKSAAYGIGLTDEYLAAAAQDEEREERTDRLQKLQLSVVSMLIGAEMTLNENYYSKKNRSELLGVIAETLPRFKPVLPGDFKIEYRVKLERQKKQFKDKKSQQLLTQMTELLAH